MKTILAVPALVLAGVVAITAVARAAPVDKATPAAATPVNWTGFYVGGDIGGLSRKGRGESDFFEQSSLPHTFQGQSISASSAAGGVHAGFNWQFAPSWVIGIEGDWQWTRSQFSGCRQTFIDPFGCVVGPFTGLISVGDDIHSFGTARGRLGIAFDRMLVYGTGGVAFTDVRTSMSVDCSDLGCSSGIPGTAAAEFSQHKTGWVAGGGLEWMFMPNWAVRAEYLHADFGNLTHTLFMAPINCANFALIIGTCGVSWSREMQFDTVRLGLSYKFGGF